MTMKKRFLGLALAAMVAVPATTAYANTNTTTIQGSENETKTHQITVQGVVDNKDGEAPDGMISVELPTKMAFTVDKAGRFSGSDFTVSNKGKIDIDLSVANFREAKTGEGIDVLPESALLDPAQKYRNQISLRLIGEENDIDLGEFDPNAVNKNDNKLASITAGNTSVISLQGKAGTKETASGSDDAQKQEAEKVDREGAQEDFTLVFRINKKKA